MLGAGVRDTLGTRVISRALGTHDDLVRLPAGLGQYGLPLVGGCLAVSPRGVSVHESLLDPVTPLAQLLRDRLEGDLPRDGEEDQEVEGADDDPEQVDRQAAAASTLFRSEDRGIPEEAAGDGEQVHHVLLWPRLLDEDGEQADHDREHAKAFRERGEDDGEAADLGGCVGVAADGGGRHAARGCRCRCRVR